MARAPLGLKAYALSLLARREYSRSELAQRLKVQARKLALWQAQDRLGAVEAAAVDPMAAFLAGRVEAVPSALTPDPEWLEARTEAAVAEVDAVLDWLAQQRYQSDERFIESRVHARAGRFGQARIRQELARHGVELDSDTAQSLRDTEFARARELWRKRFGTPATEPSERARQMRFLAARGFSPELIRRVVGGRDDD
jgi:regulatory protein